MRTAVVTGASRGIGRGIAHALVNAGCAVVVGATGEGADAVAAELTDLGGRAVAVRGDIADPATSAALRDAAVQHFGGLDVWVNNAGVSVLAPVVDTPERDLRRMLDVNVVGVHHGMVAAVGAMRSSGRGGRIVNVASELGVQAFAYLGAYAATKFAVVGMSQAAALELASEGITVNAVCPGTTETDMVLAERASEVALTGTPSEAVRNSYLDAIPAGRFCTPEDVGATVAWLASEGAAFVTGQAICVNGGAVLH